MLKYIQLCFKIRIFFFHLFLNLLIILCVCSPDDVYLLWRVFDIYMSAIVYTRIGQEETEEEKKNIFDIRGDQELKIYAIADLIYT